MERYRINKGIGKPWEFKGICPFFSMMGIGLIIICSILFFCLFFCFGIWPAASISSPLVAVGIQQILKLNKQFGQDGFYRWLAKKKRPKALYNTGELHKNLFRKGV